VRYVGSFVASATAIADTRVLQQDPAHTARTSQITDLSPATTPNNPT